MPSMELFDQQSHDYKNLVLPNVKTLAIEMASELPWYKYTKHVYGVSEFGLSAPQDVVVEKYGFTKEKVLLKYKEI
jgi:transketolase